MSNPYAIELSDVSVVQIEGQEILQNVNLKIHKGEFVYLVGKTGTGKSSLLKTIYGELPLKIGEGMLDGMVLNNINRKQRPELRRKIGIVFQDFQLLQDRTVLDNLLFVLRATDWKDEVKMKNRAMQVLNLVNMEWAADKMPKLISGGEQQRIVIARALLNQPSIIIADEPTGNLDPDTSDDIMKLIHDLSQDQETAVIMATHDYRLINKFPGKVYKTVNGTLVDGEVY